MPTRTGEVAEPSPITADTKGHAAPSDQVTYSSGYSVPSISNKIPLNQ